ncbi:MAG: CBS domain-containing protein [Candidatus Methanomethyliaceae archaeon]|nr:CBS domain-containing protein [Candidatus Methanomethyliaceae archaeon]
MPKTLREEFPSVLDVFYGDYQRHRHVSEIMSKEVAMIEGTATMLNAAKIMGKQHIGSLLVKGRDRPAGIVTERDLLTRVIAANKDPKKVKVFDVMSPRLITIKPQVTIREAARTMIKEKGRLVVMEERDLVGILTASDLIRSLPEAPETSTLVSKFMTRQVASVKPNAKVRDTAKKMGRERIGSVIIKKGEKPWGIFTERDLLTKVIYMDGNLDEVVEKYSSTPLITIGIDCSIHKAAQMMTAKHVRRLPVLERSKLTGIITARDLVEAYAL